MVFVFHLSHETASAKIDGYPYCINERESFGTYRSIFFCLKYHSSLYVVYRSGSAPSLVHIIVREFLILMASLRVNDTCRVR